MPSRQLFVNNARATLASGISSGAVAVTVNAGEGARFGTPPAANEFILATLRNAAGSVTEIVKITARSGDTLTIVRAQEGTAASAFSAGDTISVRWTAGAAQRLPQKDADETITGAWAFPTPTAPTHVTSKSYVDGRVAALSLETLIDNADSLPFYDVSATLDKRITLPDAALALSLARQTGFLLSSTVATSLTHNAYTRVQLTESWDPGGNIPGAGYYVAPATGLYFVFGCASVSITNAIATTVATALERATSGGVSISISNFDLAVLQIVSTPAPGGAQIINANAGERFYLNVFQNNGGPRNTSAGGACYLGGWRIA